MSERDAVLSVRLLPEQDAGEWRGQRTTSTPSFRRPGEPGIPPRRAMSMAMGLQHSSSLMLDKGGPDYLRDMWLLSGAYLLAVSVIFAHVAISSLAVADLNPPAGLALLPLGCLIASSAVAIPPVGKILERVGYKTMFLVGPLLGAAGAVMCAVAIKKGHGGFFLFCIGVVPQGIAYGIAHFMRHCAVSTLATPAQQGTAVSIVVVSACMSGVVGPGLATAVRRLVDHAAVYYAIAIINAVQFLLLLPLRVPSKPQSQVASATKDAQPAPPLEKRPLCTIVCSPDYLLCVLMAGVAHSTMVAVMGASPLVLKSEHRSVTLSSAIIAIHVFAMYFPSMLTSKAMQRYGPKKVMSVGVVVLAAGLAIFYGRTALWVGVSLFVVGVGWNLTFVASTRQLACVYRPQEKVCCVCCCLSFPDLFCFRVFILFVLTFFDAPARPGVCLRGSFLRKR